MQNNQNWPETPLNFMFYQETHLRFRDRDSTGMVGREEAGGVLCIKTIKTDSKL